MKVLIHQPSYFPWIGLFDLIERADMVIWYDTAQYTKNDWRNRNRIKGPSGPMWMTVPVHGSTHKAIRDIVPANDEWRNTHLKMLRMNYAKAPYFSEVMDLVEYSMSCPYGKSIADIAAHCTMRCVDYMRIKREVRWVSKLENDGCSSAFTDDPTQKLIRMIRFVNGTEYITSDGAKGYLDTKQFDSEKIRVKFHNYRHPVYPQLWGDFVSHLSILDMLFNCGSDTGQLL